MSLLQEFVALTIGVGVENTEVTKSILTFSQKPHVMVSNLASFALFDILTCGSASDNGINLGLISVSLLSLRRMNIKPPFLQLIPC